MPHHTPLIATIVGGLVAAFILGALAQRFRISPLVGYLLAGVLVGPFTPGFVADQNLANELAEIGVILLMFGVGLHFSLKDLLSVRNIAIPGAVVQMAAATLMGVGLGHLLGWPLVSGLVLGLSLSVASTVVLMRALQERRALNTDRGRIAVGWLIVEDLAMVLTLVLLPALAGAIGPQAEPGEAAGAMTWLAPIGVTLAKVAAFVAFMLIVGRRVIPWVLHYVAHTGSRELFRLAVLAIALGVAFGAAALFDVSFALGAFFAGMILSESELSQQAAEETLPLRDAFAVLFFVSVGMLFDPAVLVEQPWALAGVLAIVTLGKSVAAFAIVSLFRHPRETAMTVSVSLAQIGEFSFILASLGVALGLLPQEGQALILAGAIFSICLNPLLFKLFAPAPRPRPAAPAPEAGDLAPTRLTDHTVVVGYGRVGAAIAQRLDALEEPFLVVDVSEARTRHAAAAGCEALAGNAADGRTLAAAGIDRARGLIVAIPDGFEAGQIVEQAKRVNPALRAVARAHSDVEVEHLAAHGADETVLGEQELAESLLHRALIRRRRPDAAAAEAAPAGAPSRLLLDDAERALLSGVKQRELGPGQAISEASLMTDAARLGAYGQARLEAAIATLAGKGCLTRFGDGRAAPTLAGVIAASTAPDY
ncbi:MAG: YbaL family putative K(+) efflux transporter [Phenylobacterium sp.]